MPPVDVLRSPDRQPVGTGRNKAESPVIVVVHNLSLAVSPLASMPPLLRARFQTCVGRCTGRCRASASGNNASLQRRGCFRSSERSPKKEDLGGNHGVISTSAHRGAQCRTEIKHLRAPARARSQIILTPPTAWSLFKRSSVAAFERSVTLSSLWPPSGSGPNRAPTCGVKGEGETPFLTLCS